MEENRTKIVGIIGPYYSGGDPRLIDHNIANARAVMKAIANRFADSQLIGFFCPHSHTSKFEREAQAPEPYYHTMDSTIYKAACEGFVVLPHWQVSDGSRRDIEMVGALKRKLFFLRGYSPEDLIPLLNELEKWAKES